MRRKTLLILLLLILLSSISTPVQAKELSAPKIYINDQLIETDVDPIIVNDRTLVPIRVISENLGCEVEWEPETREAMIMQFGNGNLYFNPVINLETFEEIRSTFSYPIGSYYVQIIHKDFINAYYHLTYLVSYGQEYKGIDLSPILDELRSYVDDYCYTYFIDSPAIIHNDRTMVPIRSVSDLLGVHIHWDDNTRSVIIYTPW